MGKGYHHQHWAAVLSRGWAKDAAGHLQVSLFCAVFCQIVSLQQLSRSSLHRLASLSCPIFLSYGLQVMTREVHRLSLRRLICRALVVTVANAGEAIWWMASLWKSPSSKRSPRRRSLSDASPAGFRD